jgi:O-antigen/teichoic acid export membrane protein
MTILTKYREYLPVITNFFAYAIGSVMLRAATAIIAFMSLRIFTPAEFGVLALVNNFVGIFPNILNPGIRQAFGLEYFHLTSRERRTVLNHAIFTYLIIAIPSLIICFYSLDFINKIIFLNGATRTIIVIALIYCFIQFFSELYLQILRYQMRALLLTTVQLCAAVLSIITNIILVFYLHWGITGAICANTIGIAALSLWGLWQYFRHQTNLFWSSDQLTAHAKSLLVLGFPFVPNILFAWLLSSGNRWLLAYLTNMETVGIYALADMVGQMFNLCILYPMSGSYIPYMLQQFAQHPERARELEVQNRKAMWISMAVMTVCITLATGVAFIFGPSILPPKYLQALNYIWFILLGYIFLMGTYFSSCYLLYRKKTWLLLGITAISALVNVLLNLLFIPYFSIYGSVFASLMAYILFFVLNIKATSTVLSQNN